MGGGFHPPASVQETWPEPNYDDPEAKGKELLVVTIIFTVLAIIVVSLRLFTRLFLQRQGGLDDILIVLSMIPLIGLSALLILTETKFRWYRHVWDVPPETFTGREYHSWIVEILFHLANSCGKLSILFLYKRVIKGVANVTFLRVVNGVIIFLIVYSILFTILAVVQCVPTDAFWLQYSYPEPYTSEFKCFYEGSIPLSQAVISTTTDFLTTILPMFLFWQLHMPTRGKIALGALFGIGFITCICGILRALFIRKLFYESYDVTWMSHTAWIYTIVENCMLVICASIPPLNVLIKRVAGISFSRSSQKEGNSRSHWYTSFSRMSRPNKTTNMSSTRSAEDEIELNPGSNPSHFGHFNRIQKMDPVLDEFQPGHHSRPGSKDGIMKEISISQDVWHRDEGPK